MRNHGPPNLRVKGIPRQRDTGEYRKEENVEAEEDVTYVLQPLRIVRQVMKEDGNDASSHVDCKPTIPQDTVSFTFPNCVCTALSCRNTTVEL